MALHQMTGLTPHLTEVDLDHLTGDQVLGEPLAVLMAAVLRLRLVSVDDAHATLAGSMAPDEWAALQRAMARVDGHLLPRRSRLDGDEDGARLVAVLRLASRAADDAIARIIGRPA